MPAISFSVCAWCRFSFHWRASGMSCIMDTILCKMCTHCPTSTCVLLSTEAFPPGSGASCSLSHAGSVPGVAAWCPDTTACGREWETLFVLISSDAAAGRKANSTNMAANKRLYFEIKGLRVDVLQSQFNTQMWGHFWRQATPLALELLSCLEILRKFLF